MEFTLFEEFIPLQALLKKAGLTQSGGSIKELIAEQAIYYNGAVETRRRKKIYLGDEVTIPSQNFHIVLVSPTDEERQVHLEDEAEKRRVQETVKALNKNIKQKQKNMEKARGSKPPVRFPGR